MIKQKNMIKQLKRAIMIAGALVLGHAFAEEPLAAQAGSDTLSRATQAAPVEEIVETPDARPDLGAPNAAGEDSIKIGRISQIAISGDVEFAKSEKVGELLEAELCDGSEKTIGDLKATIFSVRKQLINRGFYLINIDVASANAYHRETETLDLTVNPGYFGEVDVNHEDGWYSNEQIEKRFKYIKEGEPFNYNKLRGALRTLNGHPDITADTTLSVDAARRVNTKLDVDDSIPLHASFEVNNHAMDELDNWQMVATLQYLNCTKADDVITISPALTFNGDMWSIAGSYQRPFDLFRGGQWSVYGGYSDMELDNVLPSLSVEGAGGFAGFNLSFNLYDTDERNVALNLGVLYRYLEDQWSVLGYQLRDRDIGILPLTAGLSYADKKRDAFGGLNYASASLSYNVADIGDNFKAYSESAETNYMIARLALARLQPLYGPDKDGEEWRCWSLFQRFEGQYSDDELISAERLAFGGHDCLRGYRRRGYLGDSGLYGTSEFRTPVWMFSPARVQLHTFLDYGYINYNESYAGIEQTEYLMSAGIGARLALSRYASLNCDLAVPLVDGYNKDEDEDCEVYISFKLQW